MSIASQSLHKKSSLVDWFLKSAQRFPEALALLVKGENYTYRQLSMEAKKICVCIQESDPAPGDPLVAIYSYRSLSAYSGVIGALQAGKTYVPFNPKFPRQRNLEVLKQTNCKVIILDKRSEESAREVFEGDAETRLFILPEYDKAPEWLEHSKNLVRTKSDLAEFSLRVSNHDAQPAELAYIIFTSGTTGQPKGVKIPHHAVNRFIKTVLDDFLPNESDHFTQISDLTFDWSIPELWACWGSGARLCVVPEESVIAPAQFLRENRVSVCFFVPSAITFMKRLGMLKSASFPYVRLTFFCGEALTADQATDWQNAATTSRIENFYGPTEAAVSITTYSWNSKTSPNDCENGIVPIGKPFVEQACAIIDENFQFVKSGEMGELLLSGSQLCSGYWKNETLTNEKFIRLSDNEAIWYRTGDLAKEKPNVGLVYCGRIDHQIKILGYRVETQEIASVIKKQTKASHAEVLGWPVSAAGATGLIAFVSKNGFTSEEILSNCKQNLPMYMVPREIHFIDNFPINANGKIDRNALIKQRESM